MANIVNRYLCPDKNMFLQITFSLVFSLFLVSLANAYDYVPGGRRVISSSSENTIRPIDRRNFIPAESLMKLDKGKWISEEINTEFAFDELIYSWSVRLPEGQGFRLYLRAGFEEGNWTTWIYGGFWGKVSLVDHRENPVFEEGKLLMDQLLLNKKAIKYQFKFEDEGEQPLRILPDLNVVYTDNTPEESLSYHYNYVEVRIPVQRKILDLPFRTQQDPLKRWTGKCQSACLAIAMEYFGKPIPLEDIIPYTHDPEYDFPGIWPRYIGAGIEFGFDAYIDRFRTWDRVRATIEENKVILCTIEMPEGGDYIDPPYPHIGGHIVALNGLTDDGRVIVTDPVFSEKERGYRVQWLLEDFEKVWKKWGNAGCVICPPEGAKMRTVTDLPTFPGHKKDEPIWW